MSIPFECESCGHRGTVSPARAGSSIPCAKCGEELDIGTARPVRPRPSSGDSTVKMAVIGGVVVLVLGIGGLVGLKALQGPSQEAPPEDPVTQTDPDPVPSIPSNDGDTAPPDPDPPRESTLPAMDAVDPQQILLANMKQVVLEVKSLENDSRKVVTGALRAGTEEALQKCQLKCVAEGKAGTPKLIVTPALTKEAGYTRLRLSAELQGDMQGIPVKFWSEDAPVVVMDQSTVDSGIMPPGLQREIGSYFKTLRDQVVKARRVVKARQETKRLQDEG